MKAPNIFNKCLNPWVVISFIAVMSGIAGAVWFYHNFEKKEYEVPLGVSPEARNNPFLAAQKYLLDQAVDAESRRGMELLISLPSTDDAIILRRTPAGLSGNVIDNIMNWVDKGGHLLLVPHFGSSEHPGTRDLVGEVGADLIEYKKSSDCGCSTTSDDESDDGNEDDSEDLGEEKIVEPVTDDPYEDVENRNDDRGSEEETDDTETDDDEDEYRDSEYIIDLDVGGHRVAVEYDGSRLLEDVAENADFRIDGSYRVEYLEKKEGDDIKEQVVKEKEGAWLLQYKRGAGKVTVLSELDLFYNDYIDKHDHAFFLSWLLGDVEKVWLLYRLDEKSLFVILWGKFLYFWLSLLILLCLLFWRMQKISGGRYPLQDMAQRNILAHIDATGLFQWRLDMCAGIIESNRTTLFNRWVRKKLGSRKVGTEAEMMAWMAEKTGITNDEVYLAFKCKIGNEQDLIQVSREMMKIHNKIQGGEHSGNEK